MHARALTMKETTKENVVITIAGLLSAVLVVTVGTLLALHGVSFSFRWFNLAITTVTVFGGLGYFYSEDLRRSIRCRTVFSAMLAGHVCLFLFLFRHGIGVSSAAIGFTAIPEAGVAGVILIVLGGAKYGYRR